MLKFKTVLIILLFTIGLGCDGIPPTEFGKQVLKIVEAQKQKTGVYPDIIEGSLTGKVYSSIKENDFFYIVDSSRTFFTLKVFLNNGLSDNYDSKTKKWVRTDK